MHILVQNQFIKTTWHYKNKQWYEERGYMFTEFRDKLVVKADDLRPFSHEMVKVICDQCGKEFERDFRSYYKAQQDEYGDCCRKCNHIRATKTNRKRYGVDWCLQREDFREKQKQTCLDKYGVEYIGQDANFRKTVERTCLEKYGYTSIGACPEIQTKARRTMQKNGTCPTSREQLALFAMLSEIYPNAQLNYPVGRCSLDCYVEINNVQIDIEYDGWYWHKDTQEEDRRRNYWLIKQGYKVLRYVSRRALPTADELKQDIKNLVTTDKNLIIKILD